jgi:hypothetical protein
MSFRTAAKSFPTTSAGSLYDLDPGPGSGLTEHPTFYGCLIELRPAGTREFRGWRNLEDAFNVINASLSRCGDVLSHLDEQRRS